MKSLTKILEDARLDRASLPTRHACLQAWIAHRIAFGLTGAPKLLGNPLDNIKIRKSLVPTWTLTLSAHRTSGVVNTCVKSTAQCRKACVMLTSGNARFAAVQDGRACRTTFFAADPLHAIGLLTHEVEALEKRGTPFGLRLNVASDVRWELIAPWLFDGPNVRAYDYTKWHPIDRMVARNHENYRLTYSHSERMDLQQVRDMLWFGDNVAVVFPCHKHELPTEWEGMPVIDGDVTDFRYDDPKGVIVGLAAKGAARGMDEGGFIVSIGGRG